MSKIEQLSDILSISERRIQQLAADGVIPKPKKQGNYDIPICVRSYFEYINADDDEKDKLDGKQERARKAKAEADRIEFELDIKKKKYVQTEFVQHEIEKVFANCRAKLLSLPRKAATLTISAENAAQAEEILSKLINEALDELTEPSFDEPTTRDIEDTEDNTESS